MTPDSPPPAVPRLDEELERLIAECAGANWDCAEGKVTWHAIQAAEDALRFRISQLISEARAEGAQDTERLDALDNTCRAISLRPPHFDGSRKVFRWQVDMEGASSLRPSVREAIDATFAEPSR